MQDFLFIKLGKKFSKIFFTEIIYVEAVKKYVRIVTAKKVYLILASMCSVERVLPASQFCRIHRSYIISLRYTTDFDSDVVYIGEKIFPIGKQHSGMLHERVIILSGEIRNESSLNNNNNEATLIGNLNEQVIVNASK
jgi:hypothetical protein